MMNRKALITWHLYAAAFFTPILLMMAISGGLYLLDFKGSTDQQSVYSGLGPKLDFTKQEDWLKLKAWLGEQGLEYDFEYLRGNETSAVGRPTSRDFFHFKQTTENGVTEYKIVAHSPDAIKTIVELHKGHGPQLFKTLQQVLAAGLIFILVTGCWLGLTSPLLKVKTLTLSGLGILITLIAALI